MVRPLLVLDFVQSLLIFPGASFLPDISVVLLLAYWFGEMEAETISHDNHWNSFHMCTVYTWDNREGPKLWIKSQHRSADKLSRHLTGDREGYIQTPHSKNKTGHSYISVLNSLRCTERLHQGPHDKAHTPKCQNMLNASLLVWTHRYHVGTDDRFPAKPGTSKLPMSRKCVLS